MGERMNKAQLISAIAEQTGLPKTHVTHVIEAQAELVASTLRDANEVTLFGIGKLKPVEKAARQGRNPLTGDPVQIPARTAVKFVVSKALKDSLN
nr:HU family DNA-binding protein [Kaistia sp. 32K]